MNKLKTTRTYACGYTNEELEIEATQDGIELSLGGILIPWEWIDSARRILIQESGGLECPWFVPISVVEESIRNAPKND